MQKHQIEKGMRVTDGERIGTVYSMGPNNPLITIAFDDGTYDKRTPDDLKPSSLILTRVTGDWLEEGKSYSAYVDPQTWNGWAIPYFTRLVAEKVVEDQNRFHKQDPEGFPEWFEWDGNVLCYHYEEEGQTAYYDREEPIGNLYSVGGMSWCWYVAEPANA